MEQGGKTSLHHSFSTPPFKVANVTQGRRSEWLDLMLMSSSPGVLDHDRYELNVEVGENARLHLQTQSYQRIFNMGSGAVQHVTIRLRENASFIYLPHPVVPHEKSIFEGRNQIFLMRGCSLTWGEVITCGRKLNGEVFRMSSYHSITEIFFDQKLLMKENVLLVPEQKNPQIIGQLEQYTHQASFIFIHEKLQKDDAISHVHSLLSGESNLEFGATALFDEGILVRMMGFGAEQLHQCMHQISKMLSKKIQETIHAD